MKFGVQLYTLRNEIKNEEELKQTFAFLGQIGMPSVELACMPKTDANVLKALSAQNGLEIASSHNSLFDLKWRQKQLIQSHKIYGAAYIGIGGMPPKYRKSKKTVLRFIEKYNRLALQYAQAGIKLVYHNHAFEFSKLEDTTIFELMCRNFNEHVGFCLDCYWAYAAGENVEACMNRLGTRLDILHFKGCKMVAGACKITPLVDGVLDFQRYLQLGAKCGVTHVFIELDESENPKQEVEQSLLYLNNLKECNKC